jgi:putative tryptophan/tyrosine transport system substrate-binding protein
MGSDMQRREFITFVGGAVAAWPLAARAQQPAVPVIGFLNSASPDREVYRVRAFRQGLSETGYFEGRNVAIEYRWAEGQNDRLPELANDLVRRQVTVIAAGYNIAADLAAKTATTTIPIVFQTGVDPVEAGLVASLNRPGGNLTGVTNLSNQVVPKHLEVLHELVPTAKDITLLVNPTNPAAVTISRDAQTAAQTIGLQLHVLRASAEREFETVFANLRQPQASALVISPDSFFNSRNGQLAALALRYTVPAISAFSDYTVAGGLMSYGGSAADQGRQAGVYTGRILKGEKPADLPVVQVAKVELVINLKTAKTLGINIPLPLLGRADEVIE